MNNQILVLTSDNAVHKKLIDQLDWPDASVQYTSDPQQAAELAPKADIFFGAPDKIAPLLDKATQLKWVQSTWAGVEPFVKPDVRKDYALTNVRGIFGRLIAEYALAYILAHERHLHTHAASQQNKAWEPVVTGQLRGKTIGIVGVGSIGADVARLFKLLGLTVWGFTRSSKECLEIDRYFHPSSPHSADDLLKMVAGVDYLISIMPHTPESGNMLDKAVFNAMRPSALLLNAGRGSAVVDEDLVEALENGEIAGAILDVFRQEPLPADHPFWTTKNLTITPHTSAPSLPTDVVPIFHENYLRFLAGERLNYQIDFEKGY